MVKYDIIHSELVGTSVRGCSKLLISGAKGVYDVKCDIIPVVLRRYLSLAVNMQSGSCWLYNRDNLKATESLKL